MIRNAYVRMHENAQTANSSASVLNFDSKYEHVYFSVWSYWGQCKIFDLAN